MATLEPAPRSGPGEASAGPGPAILSEALLRRLAAEVGRAGFAVVPRWLGDEPLTRLQRFVASAVQQSEGEYVVFSGKQALAGTLITELAEDPGFVGMMQGFYEASAGQPAPPSQPIYPVLRCLAGETGLKHCLNFHYDSYVVTLLLPITVPAEGRRGHLLLARKRRGIRRSYLHNLLDKLVVDNPVSQAVLRALYRRRWLKLLRIELTPGDLYVFEGYRTLHTNDGYAPGDVRATALFHFGDPHHASALRRKMGRVAA